LFDAKPLPAVRDVVAPDGSDVRILLSLDAGGLAHFELAPGETSVAVVHRTVGEIWYCLTGRGEMWRKIEGSESVVEVGPELCLTIPVGALFQFRSFGSEPLRAIAATLPPWPGEGEARIVTGPWEPTVSPGPT